MNTLTFEIPHGLAYRLAMPVREAYIRHLGAKAARAKRAELAHDVRSWRNGQARFWINVAMRNARPVVAPKPLPRPTRDCGCEYHRACTCPWWVA